MASRTITLTTDFGADSAYVAQMKGVIYGLDPDARVVDITHAIAPQDVEQASWVLVDVAEAFAPDTVHVVVVDPGVGSRRSILCACFLPGTYLAPDNGVLSRLADRHDLLELIDVNEPRYWRPRVSSTFHGRDVFAPVAARLSQGVPPRDLGVVRDDMCRIRWPAVQLSGDSATGQVRGIDRFGNLITDLHRDDLTRLGGFDSVSTRCGNHTVAGISDHYAQRPAGELVALIGSSDFLELAVVNGNAAERLGVRRGSRVTVAR